MIYKGVDRELKDINNNNNIWQNIKLYILELIPENANRKVYASGSRITGYYLENSDYDMVVEPSDDFNKYELQKRLTSICGFKIDILFKANNKILI